MTREDLDRCAAELEPLVPLDAASALARAQARAFNADASDVRDAVLDPFRALLDAGRAREDLVDCTERTVAELVFWRRVLVGFHPGAFAPRAGGSDCLLRYLLS